MIMPRDPFQDWFKTSLAVTMMMTEAQMVIAMRMMGMAGLWTMAPSEFPRMFTEKAEAAVRSGQAALVAMAGGATPAKVARAAVKPVRRKTRANVRRLTRAGPPGF